MTTQALIPALAVAALTATIAIARTQPVSEPSASILRQVDGAKVYDLAVEDAHATTHITPDDAGAQPPIISRGILIDVAGTKRGGVLPASYQITPADLQLALSRQGTALHPGDAVFVRTAKMRQFGDAHAYLADSPGLSVASAKWLVEKHGAILVGGDNLERAGLATHSFLRAAGVPRLEVVNLEDLARDRVYELAFIGTGARGAPLRPLALPLRIP